MKLHEYQSKELFRRYHIPVPNGVLINARDDAADAFDKLRAPRVVLKAQVHAGGRGKAGGIRIVETLEDATNAAAQMLGARLVTRQTGPDGQPVNYILMEPAMDIAAEVYVGTVVDRSAGMLSLIVCSEGGVEIEEVASRSPEKILRETFDPCQGLHAFQARRLFFALGLDNELMRPLAGVLTALAKLFLAEDCSLAEVNPLAITRDGRVMALDAKVNIDDNAVWRHRETGAWRDTSQEDAREVRAAEHGLSYIGLDGNIGCMVNGAGLAMATMDILQSYGGEPANFLDVGGGATPEKVTAAFKIILSDPGVRAVLVNIFGGIMRCDIIAEGIIAAAREVRVDRPLVVRLEGTRVAEGRQMLQDSQLPLHTAQSISEAARIAVELAQAS